MKTAKPLTDDSGFLSASANQLLSPGDHTVNDSAFFGEDKLGI